MVRVSVITCILALAASVIDAQVRSVRDKESANILKFEKYTLDSSVKVESVTGFPDKSSLVMNPTKTTKAYVLCILNGLCDPDCTARVFFTDIKTGETYMISGEPSEAEVMRPISELKWIDNRRLSYERWMNPRFGRRYVVDAVSRKQTAAFIVSDQR